MLNLWKKVFGMAGRNRLGLWLRWLLVLLGCGLVLGLFSVLRHFPPETSTGYWRCPLHEHTGLFCAGCGGTRALSRLCRGDLLGALRMNCLVVLLLLPALAYTLLSCLFRFLHGAYLPWPRVSARMMLGVIIVIVLFGVLRNIPVMPFSYLAPPFGAVTRLATP